ncbi:hypothetical protein C8R44DRAFT_843191 [Mycena epipterygia]|nr:hypothetical protein C8R44DRAFT_843191 [Mycena epipterygia]
MKELNVPIVGAEIIGLQTALALAADGHTATVLESVKQFLEVRHPQSPSVPTGGAPGRRRYPRSPNSSRLSLSWGVDLNFVKKEISLGNRFVDWHGARLLDCAFDDVRTRCGAPYYFIHRADLMDALVAAVRAHVDITLRMDTTVTSYDFDVPAVKTLAGERVAADLVICADGIKSAMRSAVNGCAVDPVDTGDVAYRILVSAAPLLADLEICHLVKNAWTVHWMAIPCVVACYRGEPIGLDEWCSEADNAHLVARFADWCLEVRKLCALTGTYLKWKLADFAQLDRWVHPARRVALLGDACHPMMPYIAQATEDAATIAAALREYDDIPTALAAYEAQRKPRAAYVARNTRVLQEWLHVYDGPEQERRYKLMRHDNSNNPMFWGFSERRRWLFGHDATLLRPEEIPGLPHMPHPEALVYKNTGRRVDSSSEWICW